MAKLELDASVAFSALFFTIGVLIASLALTCMFFQQKQKKFDMETQEEKKLVKEEKEKKTESNYRISAPEQNYRASTTVRASRFEEEGSKKSSSEYTRRGQLWSKHASWSLDVPITPDPNKIAESLEGLYHVKEILRMYDVDLKTGFLPSTDPLQRLPYARYHIWEDLGDDMPRLLGARLGQARVPLRQLPVISTSKLITDAELRRAHLLLSLFAHAYIWGGNSPLDVLPEGIAVPLWEVSQRLGIPPILGHTDIVLYNWRRLDVNGDICMENLSTLNMFFDGRDESWFYLITVEIEARGAASIVPMMLMLDAIERYNEENEEESGDRRMLNGDDFDNNNDTSPVNDMEELVGELSSRRLVTYITAQLNKIAKSTQLMCQSMENMREGCHPLIFFQRVRPFLSGWKHNPTVPNGIIYQGVSEEPKQYYGGSAAQSPLLPFLDISFGIKHDSQKSTEFLLAMREYMSKPHRDFLTYLEGRANLREWITAILEKYKIEPTTSINDIVLAENNNQARVATESNSSMNNYNEIRKLLITMRNAHDKCVSNLKRFRTSHMNIAAEYILAQQKQLKSNTIENAAGGKGTGGTDLVNFLKPIRDDCQDTILGIEDRRRLNSVDVKFTASPAAIAAAAAAAAAAQSGAEPLPYYKDNGSNADMDVFKTKQAKTSA